MAKFTRHPRRDAPTINAQELELIFAIVRGLDPDDYVTDEAKALIYKLKGLPEKGGVRFV